jgi:uncharacterized YccA/Bax inhibitor family protein
MSEVDVMSELDVMSEVEATVQSSNRVLGRLGQVAQAERVAQGQAQGYPAPPGYPSLITPTGVSRPMTIDDVVTRTIFLVGLTVVSAAISWVGLRSGAAVGLAVFGSSLAGLVLALVISFGRITNPVVISLYGILQGVVLGVVSREFERFYPGIVVQAVAGTFGVFVGMAVLYKNRVLRATPRFTRFVVGALIGVVAVSLINLLLAVFGANLGIVYYGPGDHAGVLAIGFSLLCVAVGALTFILDFDAVEQGLRYQLPERYAWYCAFGMLVGLIFLYWQLLRLLGYLRR